MNPKITGKVDIFGHAKYAVFARHRDIGKFVDRKVRSGSDIDSVSNERNGCLLKSGYSISTENETPLAMGSKSNRWPVKCLRSPSER